jgi:hypothetical protein
MYFYYYVMCYFVSLSILIVIVFRSVYSVYCLYVNMYCTAAAGCQPNVYSNAATECQPNYS